MHRFGLAALIGDLAVSGCEPADEASLEGAAAEPIAPAPGGPEPDTGVGPSGIALESSPSFEAGSVPVDMFNIVRAETAKYFAEETILSGGNIMRHEQTGIDLENQTVIRSNFDLIHYHHLRASAGNVGAFEGSGQGLAF